MSSKNAKGKGQDAKRSDKRTLNFELWTLNPSTMKLQKYMSQSGICSRRKAEEYIAAGHVFVNDEMAHIGQVIDPETDVAKILLTSFGTA